MSSIPSNISRTPNLLMSQIARDSIARSSSELLELSARMYAGKNILRPSDNPVDASLLGVLSSRLAASDQRLRNLDHASKTLGVLDQSLAEIINLARDAKTIAQDQIGATSDAASRKAQAQVVESLIQELFTLSNKSFADVHLFGGERTGAPPIERFLDGFRYRGRGDGLLTDLGPSLNTPITIGADQALGALSERLEGDVDLNPLVTRDTLVSDLRGARGLGVSLGTVTVSIDDGTPPASQIQVDLSRAANVGDVMDALESAIRAADPAALDGAFPGGVAVNGDGSGIAFDVAAGYTLTISDPGGGTTAADLGLSGGPLAGAGATQAADLDPRVGLGTAFGDFDPTSPFVAGDIVFRAGGRTGTVSVTASTTVAEFQRDVAALGLGLRVEVSADGRSLDVVNEVSGVQVSIEESGAGTFTATSLGIRSFASGTLLTDFNGGKGVRIAHGEINPVTGLPDASRNVDFEVKLSDGTTFTVDLEPDDVTVLDVLSAVNLAALNAGLTLGTGAGEFLATLGDGSNGLVLVDNIGGAEQVSVRSLNGFAARDLGLLDGSFSAGPPSELRGEDRSFVRVSSIFSTLMELKTALENNDVRGIQFAGERLEEDLERLLSARAVVGGRGQRIEAALEREENAQALDATVKSALEDIDFVEAGTRFSLLQLVQQSGYAAAARTQTLTLLDFLR